MDLINEKNDDNVVLSQKYPSVQKESNKYYYDICWVQQVYYNNIIAFFLSTWIFL